MSNWYEENTPLAKFPEGVSDQPRKSDPTALILPVINQYKAYADAGNLEACSALKEQYPELAKFIFSSLDFNTLTDEIKALQHYQLTNIDQLIQDVSNNTIGINDNPATTAEAKVNAFSGYKVNNLINTATTALNNTITNSATQLKHVKLLTLNAGSWSATAPYTQTAAAAGVTASDQPMVSIYLPGGISAANVKIHNKNYAMIDRAVTGNGTITFYCYNKKPTVNFQVMIKGV